MKWKNPRGKIMCTDKPLPEVLQKSHMAVAPCEDFIPKNKVLPIIQAFL